MKRILDYFKFKMFSIKLSYLKKEDNKNLFNAIVKYNLPHSEKPYVNMWVEFWLTTNDRAKSIVDTICLYKNVRNMNVLDVGCGMGGVLVELEKRGANSYGIEIMPDYIWLAAENFKDQDVSPKMYTKDIINEADIAEFDDIMDIVICNDVIEHVSSPEIAIKHISQILRKDGVAFFEIPNKNYPGFVLSDGHYSMYGITQLEHNEAKEYFYVTNSGNEGGYGMGHYLEISEYKELFNRYNMTFEIIEDTFNDYNKDNVLREIDVIKNTREEKCNSINDKFKKPVDEAVQKYLSRFNDISSSEDMLRLVYGAPFWKVIVKKR